LSWFLTPVKNFDTFHEQQRIIVPYHNVLGISGNEKFGRIDSEPLWASGCVGEFQFDTAQEVVFELVHSGWREEFGRGPLGHQHVARFADATLGLKKR